MIEDAISVLNDFSGALFIAILTDRLTDHVVMAGLCIAGFYMRPWWKAAIVSGIWMVLIRLVPETLFYLRIHLSNPEAYDGEFFIFMASIWIAILPVEMVIGMVVAAITSVLRSALLK